MRERSPSTRTRKDKTGRLYRSLVKTAVRKRGGEKRGRSWTPSFDEMIEMNHPPPGVVSIAFLSAPILISSFRLSPSILIEIYWNLESIPRPFHGGNATMSTSPWGAIAGRNALCACLYAGHSIWTLPPIIKTFTLRSRSSDNGCLSRTWNETYIRVSDNVSNWLTFEPSLISVEKKFEFSLIDIRFSNRALIN